MKNVSAYRFSPDLLLRIPAFSYSSYAYNTIDNLLDDPYFRQAIGEASGTLLEAVEKTEAKGDTITPKIYLALQKYHNRMCYRPTPFGIMAGFSMVKFGEDATPLVLGDQRNIHVFPGFRSALQQGSAILLAVAPAKVSYQANPSIYRVGAEYRYLKHETNTAGGKRSFLLDAAEQSELLDALLRFGQQQRTLGEYNNFLCNRFDAGKDEATQFLYDLITKQLLDCILSANITGPDYLARMKELCSPEKTGNKADPDRRVEKKVPDYSVLERPIESGSLDPLIQQKLKEGLYAADKLVSYERVEALNNFSQAFIDRFDQRAIPLLEALDPETGVGYYSLAGPVVRAALLKNINPFGSKSGDAQQRWTAAHRFLFQKWTAAATQGEQQIRITKEELDRLPGNVANYHLPPSISIMFRCLDEQVYIEEAGGASALSLIGRFTIANRECNSIAKEIAQQEAAYNPGIVFAELAHFSDLHVANIERREAIRDYELPILTGSVYDEDHRIKLSELKILVRDNEIILYSTRLQKRVIPRLSSALNYHNSDLTVFRFLCDLQYQGLKISFGFELAQFFPGLSFYPRVEFEKTILSLATWSLDVTVIKKLLEKDNAKQIENIIGLAKQLGWPKFISINEHDHQLVFDMGEQKDLALFSDLLKDGESLLIKEFPFAQERTPTVQGKGEEPFINQFVASLYQTDPIYRSYEFDLPTGEQIIKRNFLPGSEWLYLKLYCPQMRSHPLLSGELATILDELTQSGSIRQFFFIRYSDPGYHIRLRLQVAAPESIAHIITLLETRFSGLVDAGIISRYEFGVYEREIERYSPELIETVEDSFCKSAALIVAFSQHTGLAEGDHNYYSIVFGAIHAMMDAFEYDPAERIAFFEDSYRAIGTEFANAPRLKEHVKDKHRELNRHKNYHTLFTLATIPAIELHLKKFKVSYKILAHKVASWPTTRKDKLVWDLVHMHCNRAFTDLPRHQEMITHFCLWKYYLSVHARTKNLIN